MKVIFLDIDGVLNVEKFICAFVEFCKGSEISYQEMYRDRFGHKFCPVTVRFLERIIEQTGAKIVISSTWRMNGLDKIQEMWKERGLPGEVIDRTGFLHRMPIHAKIKHLPWNEQFERGREIHAWLEEHPDVTDYVIIDDDNDMLKTQQAHFVKTDPQTGLDRTLAEKAIRILNQLTLMSPTDLQKWLMDVHMIRVFVMQRSGGTFGYDIFTLNEPELCAGQPWVKQLTFTQQFYNYDDALAAGTEHGLKFIKE
jgi:HAD domain in Swiss Army Knife RNA repair proteins